MKAYLYFLSAMMLAASLYNIAVTDSPVLAFPLGGAVGAFFILARREPA
jgi:hypothetical protein